MSKKYVMLSIILFLCFMCQARALNMTGTVNVSDALNLRDAPTANSNIITGFANGTVVNIIDIVQDSDNTCGADWYKIKYGNYVGYSCSLYITNVYSNIGNTDDSYNKANYAKDNGKDGTVACYEDSTPTYLKGSATGSYNGQMVNCGEEVNILETVETPFDSSCSYHYKVSNGSASGYICGYFINTTKLSSTANDYYSKKTNGDTVASYQEQLTKLGFPQSYFPYLLELHARHPNWIFTPEMIKLKFDDVVDGESGNGASLLQKASFNENYLSTASNTYNIASNVFSEFTGEPGWYNASKEAIAYFLDPRTYLNEKYIFAFETLEYRNNQTPSIIGSYFSGRTLFNTPYSYYNDKEKNEDGLYEDGSTGKYDEDIVNASSGANVSALHVSSRILQEVGSNGSASSNGGEFTYCGNTYSGYYNFFNIGAYATSCATNVQNGLYHALTEGWNTPFRSIVGGAKFLTNNYISINQDTIYYEKFDVSTSDGHYTHQYQQNLGAPISEGGSTYNGYHRSLPVYLESAINFVIPVYEEMPNYNVTAPVLGNPNNYLKGLTINGASVNNFSYDTYNYNVYLDSNVTEVNISAEAFASTTKIAGTGTVAITSNKQVNQIKVTAGNGKVRTYTITFQRNEQKKITISEIMNNSGFKYNDKYIFGINVGTNVSTLIANIVSHNNSSVVSIASSSGTAKTNEVFKTGDKVTVTGSDGTKTYTAIIYGDTNGDGEITASDYVKVKNHIMETALLTEAYLESADVNRDGIVSAVDYVLIKNDIMDVKKISQVM